MYVCTYVCMYVCVCVYVLTSMHVWVCMYVCMYVCVYEWTGYVYVCMDMSYRPFHQLVEVNSWRADLREIVNSIHIDVCMHSTSTYVCMYVGVCTYLCMYAHLKEWRSIMYACIVCIVCMYGTCLSLHMWLHGSISLMPQVYSYILLRCTSKTME